MRVMVVRELCKSHAVCVDIAPDVFSLDDEGIAVVSLESPGEELADALMRAVFSCPEGAILVDDSNQ